MVFYHGKWIEVMRSPAANPVRPRLSTPGKGRFVIPSNSAQPEKLRRLSFPGEAVHHRSTACGTGLPDLAFEQFLSHQRREGDHHVGLHASGFLLLKD
jgi:hypothetical protein